MAEFIVGEHTYRNRPMPAKVALKMSRRLTPAANTFFPKLIEVQKGRDNTANPTSDEDYMMAMMDAATAALSKLDDEALDFITDNCLAICMRKTPTGTFNPVWNAQANASQYQDINARDMLQISINIIKAELGPFFTEALSSFQAA